MSWMAAGWVSNSRFGSANRKVVMLVIAGYATEDASGIGIDVPEGWAVCWASVARIAADAELSPATVRRVLADMEAAGVIRRQHRGRRFGIGGRTTDAIWVEYGRPFFTQTGLALNLSGNPVDSPEPPAETGKPGGDDQGLALNPEGVSAQPDGGVSAHLVSTQNLQLEPPKNQQHQLTYLTPDRAREARQARSASGGGPAPPATGQADDDRDRKEHRG
jgi:hypothetical protein